MRSIGGRLLLADAQCLHFSLRGDALGFRRRFRRSARRLLPPVCFQPLCLQAGLCLQPLHSGLLVLIGIGLIGFLSSRLTALWLQQDEGLTERELRAVRTELAEIRILLAHMSGGGVAVPTQEPQIPQPVKISEHVPPSERL